MMNTTTAIQNRKCSAEITAEKIMNRTTAASRSRINFPMAPRYVIGAVLECPPGPDAVGLAALVLPSLTGLTPGTVARFAGDSKSAG